MQQQQQWSVARLFDGEQWHSSVRVNVTDGVINRIEPCAPVDCTDLR